MADARPTIQHDDAVAALVAGEEARQQQVLELIPSENYVSQDVLAALGSVFTNKYSESNLNDYLLTINNADADKNSIMLSLIYEKKNGELNTDKDYRSCLNNKILTSDKFNSYSTDKDKITAYYNQDDISYNMACANAYYISWVYYE